MADDLKDRGARDPSRVNLHEDYEVRYWIEKSGVTKDGWSKRSGEQACRPKPLPASWGIPNHE
jgi:hypothetical protein